MITQEKAYEIACFEYGVEGLIDPECPPDAWADRLWDYCGEIEFPDEVTASRIIGNMAAWEKCNADY